MAAAANTNASGSHVVVVAHSAEVADALWRREMTTKLAVVAEVHEQSGKRDVVDNNGDDEDDMTS